mmetsp:Transcript_71662/g.203334  ORF Transcript_71662/g.203334 Transcript_71662/m.203334 type:complete len:245 (+) Transcript_71662:180-914(+)
MRLSSVVGQWLVSTRRQVMSGAPRRSRCLIRTLSPSRFSATTRSMASRSITFSPSTSMIRVMGGRLCFVAGEPWKRDETYTPQRGWPRCAATARGGACSTAPHHSTRRSVAPATTGTVASSTSRFWPARTSSSRTRSRPETAMSRSRYVSTRRPSISRMMSLSLRSSCAPVPAHRRRTDMTCGGQCSHKASASSVMAASMSMPRTAESPSFSRSAPSACTTGEAVPLRNGAKTSSIASAVIPAK